MGGWTLASFFCLGESRPGDSMVRIEAPGDFGSWTPRTHGFAGSASTLPPSPHPAGDAAFPPLLRPESRVFPSIPTSLSQRAREGDNSNINMILAGCHIWVYDYPQALSFVCGQE